MPAILRAAHQLALYAGDLGPPRHFVRNGREDTLTLTLGELPRASASARADVEEHEEQTSTDVPRLGLSLAPAKNGSEGVVVTSVDPNGSAGDRVKNGDVILDVNGKQVTSPADVRKAVSDAHAGGKHTVLMRVKSGRGRARFRRRGRSGNA